MNSIACIAVLVSCAASSLTASVGQDVPGFVFLGSAITFDGKDFNEGYYYSSASSGDWSRGEVDCRNVFGETGHLMSIESAEEQEFINKWLQDRGSGGAMFWTSGQYDNVGQMWRWAATNAEVSYSNWHPLHPSIPLLGIHRIVLDHQNQFSASWKKVDNEELHRYVCEYREPTDASSTTTPPTTTLPTTTPPTTTPDPTKPNECTIPNDLAIVLDSSGSVGLDNFLILKQFVANLTEAFTSASSSRFAFVVYSETVATVIDIAESLSPEEITRRILNAGYQAGPTPTDQGIAEVTRMLKENNSGLPRTYLVITDGISNEPDQTKAEADAAVAEGIRTYALGITENVSEQELLAIAGGTPENVFKTSDFESVVEQLAALSSALCP